MIDVRGERDTRQTGREPRGAISNVYGGLKLRDDVLGFRTIGFTLTNVFFHCGVVYHSYYLSRKCLVNSA